MGVDRTAMSAPPTAQQSGEGCSEVGVAAGVDEGVDEGGHVPEGNDHIKEVRDLY